jgi:hypothetical protein
LFIAHNAHIFFNLSLTDKFLIGAADNAIGFVFFDLVESDQREGAVNLDSFVVLGYHISRNFRLASKADFDADRVPIDAVAEDF